MLTDKQVAELKSIERGNPNYACNVINTRVAHALAKKGLVTMLEQSEHIRGEKRFTWCEFRINGAGRKMLAAITASPVGSCEAPNGGGHTTADCPGEECRRTGQCQVA